MAKLRINAIIDSQIQNKLKINLDQSFLNLCGTILDRGFFLNKKKLKNTGTSTTACLTSKRMELLNNTEEQFGF